MADQEQPQGQVPPELGDIGNSILSAFNLGVSYNQQTGNTKPIDEATAELGITIYNNLSEVYGSQFEDDFLRANTEYFLQIAMMGYIIPSICACDEDFKNRLLALISERAQKTQQTGTQGGGQPDGGGNIIIP